jgi:hypothetical protein
MMFSLTNRMPSLAVAVMAGCLAASASPAAAATVFAKFYTGTTGYTGPFSGSGTVYSNTAGAATTCPSTGSCSSDNLNTTLSFTTKGITATANTGNEVWDDLAPNFGGLGVGTGTTGSDTDDNINGSNVLTLTFASKVTLTGVGTLFDPAHGTFGSGSPSTGSFLLSVDGGAFTSISFVNANAELLSLTGTTFRFEEATNQPTFYVSAVSFVTPLPAALPLFATGIGGIGLLGWRRKKRGASPAV